MLVILIEILTEIPLQKRHIMRQLKTQNTKEIQYIKDNIKDLQAASKVKDSGDSYKYGDLKISLKLQYA